MLFHFGSIIFGSIAFFGVVGLMIAGFTQDKRLPFWKELVFLSIGALLGGVFMLVVLWFTYG
jgi:hypothetical protein